MPFTATACEGMERKAPADLVGGPLVHCSRLTA
jgi:hypothetical protein